MNRKPLRIRIAILRAKFWLWRLSFDRPSDRQLSRAINAADLRQDLRVDTCYGSSPTTVDGVYRGMPFHLYARFRIWEFTLIEIDAAEHPNVDPGWLTQDQLGFFPVGEIDGVPDIRGFCISGEYGRGQYSASYIPEPHALMLTRICCHAYDLALSGVDFPLTEFAIGCEPVTLSKDQPAITATYGIEALGHLLYGWPSPGSAGIQKIQKRRPFSRFKRAMAGGLGGLLLGVGTAQAILTWGHLSRAPWTITLLLPGLFVLTGILLAAMTDAFRSTVDR